MMCSRPAKWTSSDGQLIVRALETAKANPVERPVDPRKLARRPRALDTNDVCAYLEDVIGGLRG